MFKLAKLLLKVAYEVVAPGAGNGRISAGKCKLEYGFSLESGRLPNVVFTHLIIFTIGRTQKLGMPQLSQPNSGRTSDRIR